MRWALRARRREEGWTQHEAARQLGISRSFYSMIETAHRDPTLRLAIQIAATFRLDVEALFFDCKCLEVRQRRRG